MNPPLILPLEIQRIFIDIEKCLRAELYYPALLVALNVPDVCMALTLPKVTTVKSKDYIYFIKKYSMENDLGCDAETCYQLRCGIVHRANLAGGHRISATHVIFTTPKSNAVIHGGVMQIDDKLALTFDIVLFCKEIIAATKRWYADNHTNAIISENLKNIIRECPTGIRPFIVGPPVVASGQ